MKFLAVTFAVLPVLFTQHAFAQAAAAAAAAAAPPAAAAAAAGGIQNSTTLDPSVIATGFEQDGQAVPEAGQVASLTSSNNFINFCASTQQPITNGKQITTGSCNPAPMGQIPASTKMPSSKFTNPLNMQNLEENKAFTITMQISNIKTGNFVNAQANYYSAPQQLDATGQIIGHSHFVVEQITGLNQATATDPTKFAFFKGVNTPADGNGIVSVPVTAGLGPGVYRLASINAAANHQPVLAPIAQHGSMDDMVYFSVGADGLKQALATGQGAPAAAAGAAAAAPAAPAAAGAAAAPAAPAAPPARRFIREY